MCQDLFGIGVKTQKNLKGKPQFFGPPDFDIRGTFPS